MPFTFVNLNGKAHSNEPEGRADINYSWRVHQILNFPLSFMSVRTPSGNFPIGVGYLQNGN